MAASSSTREFHKSLTPADLPGKRVGVRSYTQTTGAWVRNILMREHGLKLELGASGSRTEGAHLTEYREPPFVTRAPGKKLIDMLMNGEVDAAILGNDLPDDPRFRPVIPNAAEAGPAWHKATGLIPINHMFVATTKLANSRPDLVLEAYNLLRQAKSVAAPRRGLTCGRSGSRRSAPRSSWCSSLQPSNRSFRSSTRSMSCLRPGARSSARAHEGADR